jgi:Zn-dependent M28 family amino/carboxypeptidase
MSVVAAGQVGYLTVKREVIEERVKAVAPDNTRREAILKSSFEAVGCRELKEQPVKHEKQPNVICVLRGDSPSTIVVGAHLDKVRAGMGAVDDWSGAALLASLYESLSGQRRTHTYIFIGFSGEEDGLVGSKYYVKNLPAKDWANIVAMINLECLGLSPTKIWVTHSDKFLVNLLVQTASTLQVPVSGVNVDKVGTDDSESFRHEKVPNITIHSVTQETIRILHTPRDQLEAINLDYYYESYRLAAAYLAILDSAMPAVLSPAASTQ